MTDLFTADFNNLTNEARYSAIADFAAAQPVESNRHDFKTIWNDDTLKAVAAFANTFGGILVIGVDKNQSSAEARLVGSPSTSELTTRIASAIATNISPTPSYDVMECYHPGETNKRFCVVRIRSDATIHLVTKKDISTPVWVRNADQTVRADAAQLRMMIEREKQSTVDTEDSILIRVHRLFDEMTIGQEYTDHASWPLGGFQRSETFFKLALVPTDGKKMLLDRRSEAEFHALVHERYRRIRSCLTGTTPVAVAVENRSHDFYEYRWYHKNLDYENRWRVTDRLDIAHATQIKKDGDWSLADVVIYTLLMLRAGAQWWESHKYFGDGILVAQLSTQNLQLARGSSGQFIKLFGPGEGDYGMRAEVLYVQPQQRAAAHASVPVNFATLRQDIPDLVTTLMNSLIRSLGHGLLWAEFKDNVHAIVCGTAG